MVSHDGLSIHVWLMRHGETDSNRLGIVQGHNATPLNEVGIQQAKTSAQALAFTPFSHVFCSDLVRTRQTVEPLVALCAQRTVAYDVRLREKGAGTAEGMKLTAFYKMQKDSGQNVRIYKPEGGESWDDVRSRAGSFYEHLLQLMRQGVAGPVLVVSHGGFIMEMVNTVVPNFSASNSAPNLSLTKLLISQTSSGRLRTQVLSWADVSYMQQTGANPCATSGGDNA